MLGSDWLAVRPFVVTQFECVSQTIVRYFIAFTSGIFYDIISIFVAEYTE